LAAARNNVPAVYSQSYFARDGGLLSYGPDPVDNFRRAAPNVDRILRGAKPGDLPVQAPTMTCGFNSIAPDRAPRFRRLNVPARPQEADDHCKRHSTDQQK
jgi:hypothetical protein